MELKWVDTLDIALDLIDAHPEIDPQYVRFTDLRDWVLALENFNDDPERSNEKILEAIQMMWIEENN
jgi:FeS assembly protein IscX